MNAPLKGLLKTPSLLMRFFSAYAFLLASSDRCFTYKYKTYAANNGGNTHEKTVENYKYLYSSLFTQ